MAFTTQIFMFAFFPIAVALYFLVAILQEKGIFSRFFLKYRVLDVTILAISLLFYMWACAIDVFLFLGYIFVIYISLAWRSKGSANLHCQFFCKKEMEQKL